MKHLQKRFLVEAVTKASKEQGIQTTWMSDDWICNLKKDNKEYFVYGYIFPLNNTSSSEIARDKSATSYILKSKKIPCVDHQLFIRPAATYDICDYSNMEKNIQTKASEWGYPIVCKDNRGAGGHLVFKIENLEQLIEASKKIWSTTRGIALSPYQNIKNEYRFFVLNGEIIFAYKKILKSNDEWKFNLNRGGGAELINIDDFPEMTKIALDSAAALNLNLCSVDIIQNIDQKDFLVLEMNTSITTEYFSQISQETYEASLQLYSKIISCLFK